MPNPTKSNSRCALRKGLFVLLTCFVGALASRAVTISQWTFESSPPPDITDSATASGGAADLGNGSASGVHASSFADWSTPEGNGSAHSWNANRWAVGDYWQFEISTIGFRNVSLSWDQTSSATGPRDFGLFFSTDGIAFTQFGMNYAVVPNGSPNPAWSSGTSQPAYRFGFDLSAITALNDDASIFLRLVLQTDVQADGVGSILAGGTDRIDNFTVNGTTVPSAVPESLPLSIAAAAILTLLLASRWLLRCIA